MACAVDVVVAGEAAADRWLGSGGGFDVSKRSSESTSRAGGGDGIGGIGTVGVARDVRSGGASVAEVRLSYAAELTAADLDGGNGTSGIAAADGSAIVSGAAPAPDPGCRPANGPAGMIVTSGNRTGSATGASASGVGPATTAFGSAISGVGTSIFAGSPERIAERCPWPRCIETAINTAVVTTAAAVPAIVGVSNGVGRALGPRAAIAANIALTAKRPSAMDASAAEPRSRPATNVMSVMHMTTTIASARETTKARIALSRTRYNQMKAPQLSVVS